MRTHAAVLVVLSLTLAGCGITGQPSASPTPTPTISAAPITTTTSTTPSTTTTTNYTNPNPPAPPSSNVADCFDADCTLLLTGPATIPLDAKTFHYPSMSVTTISTDSLTYSVTYPQGGGASTTIGVGRNNGSFGFTGSPSIEVGLTVVSGTPALILQPGAVE